MIADAAGASARLGLLSAVRLRAIGSERVRGAALVLSISICFLGAAALTAALWQRNQSDISVPRHTIDRLDLIASVLASEIQLASSREDLSPSLLADIRRRLPALAFDDQRTAYLADRHGVVVATSVTGSRRPRIMSDLLADEGFEPLGTSGTVGHARLRDGSRVLVAIKALPTGHVAVVQPYATAHLSDHGRTLRDAAPIAALLALAGLGAGCMHSRRRSRRDSLRRSRSDRFDTSLSHGRCGVWDWDTTRQRVFWSASMYQILGYDPRGEHLSAGEVAALLHPDDGGMRGLIGTASGHDARTIDREIRVRTAQGGWLWLRIKGETIHDPADGSRHLVGLAIDVTSAREAAERRARDDLRLREAVDALSEAFVLWDADDRLIVCNSKFLALNGIAGDVGVPGTPSREIISAARPPLAIRCLDPPHGHRDDARLTERQIVDGRWFHVSERRTRDGGMVSVGTDVTELKRREATLRARELHLQGSVQAAEIAAQRLALVAERNFEANQAKTEFLARVSHELRTPLNAIIGFSDVMRQQMLGPLDDRYIGYTAGIHASGLKLLEIIDGILQIARIENGQLDLSPELIALEDILTDVIAMVRTDIDAKGITIDADVPAPMVIQADGAAIREVLLQLVRNAVKFSLCEGHVRVRIRSANRGVNVFVEDSGIGIPAEVLPDLGRPFVQVEAEYSRSCGGAGLGLAIVHSLVEMHGGRFTLRSQPGTGTIALVHLPKVQPAANDAASSGPAHHATPRLIAAE
jgi:two-component system cell cycle sensor histidine kinase PleC